IDKEGGGFIMRPPILDGSNYDYWKPLMVAFLKSVNSKAWRAVNKGWEHPVNVDKDGNKTLKPEEEWDKDEEALALGNSKALNALFNGIDKNIFRLVHQCELAKDVWDILKTTHEGTSKVKMSILQLLTTKFKNLRMRDDESIKDFYMNLLDIANTSGALGEKMSDEKLVRKILRSLPKRFDMKVTAIEEAQDISKMKVEELIGSLQTFEMGISENSEKKNKSIAFVSNSQEEVEESREENLSESIAMLGKQFNKIMRRMVRSQDLIPRTSHLTSVDLMTLAEELNQKKSTVTTKGFNVMDVKGMDILELNALLISRNKRKDCQFPGLMKILRVILKKNQPNMSQPLLEFAILMKILVKMS